MRILILGLGLVVGATGLLFYLGETAPVERSPVEIEVKTDAR